MSENTPATSGIGSTASLVAGGQPDTSSSPGRSSVHVPREEQREGGGACQTKSKDAEWDTLEDGYFTDTERCELWPLVLSEKRRFESLECVGGGDGDGNLDFNTFSCGKKIVSFEAVRIHQEAQDSGQCIGCPEFDMLVAIDNVSGQLMSCLRYPLARATSSVPALPTPGSGSTAAADAAGSAEWMCMRLERARSMIREAHALRKFRHLNIVEYKGACISGGHLYMLMEMCDGGSIASILARFGALDEGLASRYTRQILSGLAYLHRHCIIHRHINPSTCLVTTTGHVKLADFGAIVANLDCLIPEIGIERALSGRRYSPPIPNATSV